MRARRPVVVLSALSGVAWGTMVTYALLGPHQRVALGSGVLLSPLVGILAGLIAVRFREFDVVGMAVVSLASLYLAAALYGLAGGFVLALAGHGGLATAISLALFLPWGMTIGGFVLWMWPLAYFNHRFVARFA